MADKLMDAIKRYDEARKALINVGTKEIPVMMEVEKTDAPTMTSARAPRDYVIGLSRWLYDHYGLFGYTNIRARLGRSHYTTDCNGDHVLNFGAKSINRAFRDGFHEYKRICQRTGLQRYTKGWLGVRQLILHEFAHVLTEADGACVKGSVHNYTFVRRYRELMALVP